MSTLTDTAASPVSMDEAEEASAHIEEQVARAKAILIEFRSVLTELAANDS
ncbi:hypothetical protein [Brevundimonas sp.]|uniref:hypothetical protein n=1 Tax=Brevundimonas sp. TaxID=1871086 RepID=UPI002737F898|nr:hypothetical protein [Brevundimonas sp.]MDP3803347.1 hypothetical protein [Brevundimonas sp.]